MQKSDVQKALEQLKATEKRNFSQKYDLIVNLKDLDLKVQDNQKDLFVALPHEKGKSVKVAALVGPELAPNAKLHTDMTITTDQFSLYDKKKIKKLANEHDFFVAQANIMPEVAKVFGRVLGPRGKMPNPKAGCVVPPNANLKPLVDRLRKTVRLAIKTQLSVKTMIGSQAMTDDQLAENVLAVYDAVLKGLPKERDNLKNVMLKLTMSSPVKITEAK